MWEFDAIFFHILKKLVLVKNGIANHPFGLTQFNKGTAMNHSTWIAAKYRTIFIVIDSPYVEIPNAFRFELRLSCRAVGVGR